MSYNIAEFVIGWHFNDQYDGETMADLSQTVFMQSNNEAFKRMNHKHTHTHKNIWKHTPTNAINENAMRCLLLKIRL